MSIPVRQSTAFECSVGPVLDADGVAVTDCVVGDFKLKKTTGNFAALNGSATLTHVSAGTYDLVLTTSDTDTVGLLTVAIDDTTNACAPVRFQVIEEAIYDALYAASANAFTGAAGSTKVSGVVLADTVTTLTNLPAITANWLTAAGTAADFTTEIQSGLATSAGLSSIDTATQALLNAAVLASGTIGSVGNDTTHLHLDGLTYGDDALNDLLLVVLDDSTGLSYSCWITDWDQSDELATVTTLPFTPENAADTYQVLGIRRNVTVSDKTGFSLASSGMDSVTLPANLITASSLDAGAVTEIQSGLATAANQSSILAVVQAIESAAIIDAGTIGNTGNDDSHVHMPDLLYGNDGINDYLLKIYDDSTGIVHLCWITDWVASTKLATVTTLPFEPEDSADTYQLLAIKRNIRSDVTAADVWNAATRVLTAGTNIALAKGTGVTGFNDIAVADVWSGRDLYHADINFAVDEANSRDEYTITWFKNGARLTSGVTSPTIQVVKRADGTDLIASTSISEIGSTESFYHNATTTARTTAGEAVLVIVTATIDAGTRTFSKIVSRDSEAP